MDLTDRSWPVVAALGRDTPAALPSVALETHGHHLPVFIDSMPLAGDLAESSLALAHGLVGNIVPSQHWSGGPWDL